MREWSTCHQAVEILLGPFLSKDAAIKSDGGLSLFFSWDGCRTRDGVGREQDGAICNAAMRFGGGAVEAWMGVWARGTQVEAGLMMMLAAHLAARLRRTCEKTRD